MILTYNLFAGVAELLSTVFVPFDLLNLGAKFLNNKHNHKLHKRADMYCDDALFLASQLSDFIHHLWLPTLIIWGVLCIMKTLNAILGGL